MSGTGTLLGDDTAGDPSFHAVAKQTQIDLLPE